MEKDYDNESARRVFGQCPENLGRPQKSWADGLKTGQPSRAMGSGFPKTVKVAILISGEDCIPFSQSKMSHGLFAGVKILLLISLRRLENDPHDIMYVKHRMLNGADRNGHSATFRFNNRNMFFAGSVCCIGCQLHPAVFAAIQSLFQNHYGIAIRAFIVGNQRKHSCFC